MNTFNHIALIAAVAFFASCSKNELVEPAISPAADADQSEISTAKPAIVMPLRGKPELTVPVQHDGAQSMTSPSGENADQHLRGKVQGSSLDVISGDENRVHIGSGAQDGALNAVMNAPDHRFRGNGQGGSLGQTSGDDDRVQTGFCVKDCAMNVVTNAPNHHFRDVPTSTSLSSALTVADDK